MTVSTTKNRINQSANGVQTVFIYDFIVPEASQMTVYFDNVLQASGYTVNGVGDPAGGDVTFDVAPTSGVTVTLQRIVDETQLVDYLPYDPFPAETHEGALDKLTLIAQQLTDEINRAIKADVTVPEGVSYTLPLPAAGEFLQWNVTEDGFVNVNISTLGDFVATTPFTESLLDDADADEFWATLMATLEKNTARTLLDVYSKAEADAAHEAADNIPARNTVLTKDALSQAGSSTPGFSAVLGTADDGITGTQYLRWTKDKNNATNWFQSDSVRGDFYLSSNLTAAEVATVPAIDADDVSYQWDLISTITGVTNRNKPYTAHYNPYLGVSVVGYEGDGADGHEIPHHLGVEPEICITKNRDSALSWNVLGTLLGNSVAGDFLALNGTGALSTVATLGTVFDNLSVRLGTNVGFNESTSNHIMYNFASVPGASKISTYIGTGADGNFVDCGFKAAFVMIRNLAVGNWTITDTIRGDNESLLANTTGAEATAYEIYSDVNGFHVDGAATNTNVLNNQYLFIAFAETSIDANKAVTNYTLPTNADQLAIANPTLMTFANGFNANGQVDVQEQIAGATLTYGATHEDKKYYIYRDNGSAWGQSEVRPLIGLTRDTADYSGVVSPSDSSLRTTAHHIDYESETGVALASGEHTGYAAYDAFNKNNNDITTAQGYEWLIATTTTSWLQYKFKEKRILKSWRLREDNQPVRTPKRFTIESSNDGLNWTEIDATYKTGTGIDYVGNGASLWGDLQDTSVNTTAYLYYRINITENSGDATYTGITELEFNTKIASDYYLIDEAKMYNDAGTRLDRVYIGEALLDSGGDVISFINYAASKQQLNEIEVHGELKLHGNFAHESAVTAWAIFDPSKTPPLIIKSSNVRDIVDTASGQSVAIFETPMDNTGYFISGSCNSGVMLNCSKIDQGLHSARIDTVLYTGSGTDPVLVMVIFHGGKEIK